MLSSSLQLCFQTNFILVSLKKNALTIMKAPLSSSLDSSFGVTYQDGMYHFTLHAKDPCAISLSIFKPGEKAAFLTLAMQQKDGDLWHAKIKELPSHFEYLYYLETGSKKPKPTLDPYAKQIASSPTFGLRHSHVRSVYRHQPLFDWGLDSRPWHRLQDITIYEAHVRGFTADGLKQGSSSFLALIDKIPHLKELGITTLELMPIFEFDETENPVETDLPLCNFWGYATRAFFSIMHRYGSSAEKANVEFKTMVKAMHAAGIEVILDVVFNHTDEGSCDRGFHGFSQLDRENYFIMSGSHHTNYSGCGNTVSCNTPTSMHFILEVLRYWTREFHIDGFRFDLGGVFYRGAKGEELIDPPILKEIIQDPILSSSKFFVEPWDAAGIYKLGSFFNYRFAEWNDKFRDDVRDFLRGKGSKKAFINRLLGSADLWPDQGPLKSVNFVAVHDGFTLFDVCSFSEKHNSSNGENSRDGCSDNKSWNCGEEGLNVSEKVMKLRLRQMRNFYLALFCSLGIPLFLMGDEYGHTKKGNNNTYCHDSCLNYFLNNELEKRRPLFNFVKQLIAFRKNSPLLTRNAFFKKEQLRELFNEESHAVFLTLDDQLAYLFNPQEKVLNFDLPPSWKEAYLIADTFDDERSFSSHVLKPANWQLMPYSALLIEKKA